jgi:hypothetical protein
VRMHVQQQRVEHPVELGAGQVGLIQVPQGRFDRGVVGAAF